MNRNLKRLEQNVTVVGSLQADRQGEVGIEQVGEAFCRTIVDSAFEYFKKHSQVTSNELPYFKQKRLMLEAKVAVMVGLKGPEVLEEFESLDSEAHYLDKGIVEMLGKGCPESLDDGYPTDLRGVLKFAEYYKKKSGN